MYNRGNLFAAFGYAALVYALAMTAVHLVGGRRHILRAVAAAAAVLIAVGWIVRSYDDVTDWDRAARLQQIALDATSDAAATVPPGQHALHVRAPGQPR